MSKAIFLIALLIASATAFTVFSKKNNIQLDNSLINADQKVKVDFYTESLCPDCLVFVNKSLRAAATTKDFWKICEFNIFPYGNARRAQNGSQWAYTCQHGVKECQGNLIEACAAKKFDFYIQGLPFIICL